MEVIAADYDNIDDMPAIGILKEDLNDDAEGEAVMMGSVSSINTNSFNVSDELYIGANGALVNSKPTTAGQFIQKIAVVVKKHSSNGVIKVIGAGRSNDVPLPLYIDNANQRVGISEPTPAEKLVVSETRTDSTASDTYTTVVKSVQGSGLTTNPGTGGLKVQYNDGTDDHGFGLVAGTSSSDFLTSGSMHFYTNSNLDTVSATGFAMAISASQQVSIGATSTDGKLFLNGGNFTIKNENPQIILKQTASGTKVSKIIAAAGSTQSPPTGEIRWQSGRIVSNQPPDGLSLRAYNPTSYVTNEIHLPSQTYDNFVITLDGTSVLEIDPVTENVGIGTSDPSSKLEIVDDLSAASTVEYPLTLSVKDDNNSIDQLGGEGVGIKFKIAGNNTTDP